MFTILHISDLHRSGGEPISNRELLSSLIADFQRSARETPSVQRPDAIVVSGDLVEGLPLESVAYPNGLREQYREAAELLECLSEEFLDGDRSRVVIVPGNHDVDWNGARMAFELEDQGKTDPLSFKRNTETNYRWSWRDRQVFRIVDIERYRQRFEYFNDMYKEFYRNANLANPVDPEQPWNIFTLDDGNIVVSAFNSCVINDCFFDLGCIRSEDIAECHLMMRRVVRQGCLPIAVWHHGVGGPPLASDYVDPATVKLMTDRGFRLGLHGHQHDSTHAVVDLFVSTREKMAVIGAGSLCAGPQTLPPGVNRRYNVIQIDRERRRGQVHVREMNQPSIWGPGQLFESGAQSYVNIDWTQSSLEVVDQGRSGGIIITQADEIERLIDTGYLDAAREMLQSAVAIPVTYKKQLLVKILRQDEAWKDLKKLLDSPQNNDELAMYAMEAERSGDVTGVDGVLNIIESNGEFSRELISEIRKRLTARLKLER